MKTISTFTPSKTNLRIAVLAIVMLFTASSIWSQGNAGSQQDGATYQDEIPQYRWGIKGGLNSAYEYNKNGSTDARTGIHIGGFMETTISPKTDLQVEFVYSMQGSVDKNGYTDKFDYINIPVIFKFYTNQPRTFSIDFGPQLGYMLSAKYVTKSGTVYDIYNRSDINKFDAAACLGISYKFNENFHICLRYNYGITQISKNFTNRNAVGQLGVGYMF